MPLLLDHNTPIVVDFEVLEKIELYFVHDLHYGSAQFDERKWKALKKRIAEDDNAMVCWLGDMMENSIPDSKSDIFEQTASPQEQMDFVEAQLADLKDKTIVVIPGNHEFNRTTKKSGIYPLYQACKTVGMSERYRNDMAFVDIGVGCRKKDRSQRNRYVGQLQHSAKSLRRYCSSDFTDGIDFFAYGHDHDPSDHPRAKTVYNPYAKAVTRRNIEVIDCGSFLDFGGYGARSAYRPLSDKMYALTLSGTDKAMETRGFYV